MPAQLHMHISNSTQHSTRAHHVLKKHPTEHPTALGKGPQSPIAHRQPILPAVLAELHQSYPSQGQWREGPPEKIPSTRVILSPVSRRCFKVAMTGNPAPTVACEALRLRRYSLQLTRNACSCYC